MGLSSSRWRFMKPMELLKLAYEAFGAKHPTGSLIVVMVLGGVLGVVVCGAAWTVAANQYQKSNTVPPAEGHLVNTTNGPQSPIMPNNGGNVTISNDNSKPKEPPPKDKSK